jgi:hypothetical protein
MLMKGQRQDGKQSVAIPPRTSIALQARLSRRCQCGTAFIYSNEPRSMNPKMSHPQATGGGRLHTRGFRRMRIQLHDLGLTAE